MPDEEKKSERAPDPAPDRAEDLAKKLSARMPLPGLAAIALYLLVLAGVIVLGVIQDHHYPPIFLVFSALFIAASGGMLMLLRWAWALALAAVFLLMAYNIWIFSATHEAPALVQGLLNLVFFLYLIRTEVEKN